MSLNERPFSRWSLSSSLSMNFIVLSCALSSQWSPYCTSFWNWGSARVTSASSGVPIVIPFSSVLAFNNVPQSSLTAFMYFPPGCKIHGKRLICWIGLSCCSLVRVVPLSSIPRIPAIASLILTGGSCQMHSNVRSASATAGSVFALFFFIHSKERSCWTSAEMVCCICSAVSASFPSPTP